VHLDSGTKIVSGELVLKVTVIVLGLPVTTTDNYNVCEISSTGCPAEGDAKVTFMKTVPSLTPNVSIFYLVITWASWHCAIQQEY